MVNEFLINDLLICKSLLIEKPLPALEFVKIYLALKIL